MEELKKYLTSEVMQELIEKGGPLKLPGGVEVKRASGRWDVLYPSGNNHAFTWFFSFTKAVECAIEKSELLSNKKSDAEKLGELVLSGDYILQSASPNENGYKQNLRYVGCDGFQKYGTKEGMEFTPSYYAKDCDDAIDAMRGSQ